MVIFGVMLTLPRRGRRGRRDPRARSGPNAATRGLPVAVGPNLEGTEVRNGPVASATWAAIHHGHLQRLGQHHARQRSTRSAGMVPMALMMLNVVFSGIGAGFENMLMYIVVAVFIAGLMVGRTPEYLGKKVEAKEVKLAMLALLIHPLVIFGGAAIFAASTVWKGFVSQPRPPRLRRDPLRVHLGRRQQRLGVRRAWPTTTRPGTSPPASSCCWAGSPP